MTQTVAVVLAGGRGTRVGAGRNKVLIDVAQRPVIEWSVRAFATHPSVDRTILVSHADDRSALEQIATKYPRVTTILGGKERADSERAALEQLRADIEAGTVGCVLLHDGARPCVSTELITRTAKVAAEHGAVPALPAPPLAAAGGHDEALRISPGRLMRAQTPQGGPARWLLAAYDAAQLGGFTGTDTASYLEYAGFRVRAIDGEEANLKVTYAEDLDIAATILEASQTA